MKDDPFKRNPERYLKLLSVLTVNNENIIPVKVKGFCVYRKRYVEHALDIVLRKSNILINKVTNIFRKRKRVFLE